MCAVTFARRRELVPILHLQLESAFTLCHLLGCRSSSLTWIAGPVAVLCTKLRDAPNFSCMLVLMFSLGQVVLWVTPDPPGLNSFCTSLSSK